MAMELLPFHYSPICRHLLESPTDDHHHNPHGIGEIRITVLLLAIVLLTTLLLYCIYRCLVPHNPSPVLHPARNSCNSEPKSTTDPRPGEVGALPVFVFSEETADPSDQESCAICLDEFAEGDCVKLLPKCKHIFHKHCIDKWLLSHSSLCPVCRDRAVEANPATARRNCRNTNIVVDPVFVAFSIPSLSRM